MKLLGVISTLALAGAQTWEEFKYGADTIVLAVCFTDMNHGYYPFIDDDGIMGMKVTADGGKTWNTSHATRFSSLLMDAACAGSNGVVGGMMDTQYSADAWGTWNVSLGPKFITQNAATINGKQESKFFALAGSGIGKNGLIISNDGGMTFTGMNISILQTVARYGAFPSKNVWHISAGDFGQLDSEDDTVARHLTPHITLHKNGKRSFRSKRNMKDPSPTPAPVPGWIGQIVSTTDAGKTWTSNYLSVGQMCFNAIACGSETNCCAVADASVGAYIMCTVDGKTWNQKLYLDGPDVGLMAIAAAGPNEYWAGGGNMNPDFMGLFFHSTDAGNTWTNQTYKNIYVNDIDIADASHGWASTLDRNEQSGIARFGYA